MSPNCCQNSPLNILKHGQHCKTDIWGRNSRCSPHGLSQSLKTYSTQTQMFLPTCGYDCEGWCYEHMHMHHSSTTLSLDKAESSIFWKPTNWQLKISFGVWAGHWLIGQHEELPAALHCVTAQSVATPWRVPSICMKVDCHSCAALPCGVTLPASHCLCILLFTFLFFSLSHCNFPPFPPVFQQCLSQGRYFAAKTVISDLSEL